MVGRFVDITGKTFGFLEVIKRVENNGRRVMWLCKCHRCGSTKVIRGDALKGGATISCGCYQREEVVVKTWHNNLIDITGKKYNRLTVLERMPSEKKDTFWLCRCDCGNLTVVTGDHLKSGHTTSCGCVYQKMLKEFQLRCMTCDGDSVIGSPYYLSELCRRLGVSDKYETIGWRLRKWKDSERALEGIVGD